MPRSVTCGACQSTFAIPDDLWERRVRGRIATLKCRNCKAEIRVDGSQAQSSEPARRHAATSHQSRTDFEHGRDARRVAVQTDASSGLTHPTSQRSDERSQGDPGGSTSESSAVPSPQASTESSDQIWVVSFGENDDRELDEAQIAAELAHGIIDADTIVWREGMQDWQPIFEIAVLARHLPAVAVAPPEAPMREGRTSEADASDAATADSQQAEPTPVGIDARHDGVPWTRTLIDFGGDLEFLTKKSVAAAGEARPPAHSSATDSIPEPASAAAIPVSESAELLEPSSPRAAASSTEGDPAPSPPPPSAKARLEPPEHSTRARERPRPPAPSARRKLGSESGEARTGHGPPPLPVRSPAAAPTSATSTPIIPWQVQDPGTDVVTRAFPDVPAASTSGVGDAAMGRIGIGAAPVLDREAPTRPEKLASPTRNPFDPGVVLTDDDFLALRRRLPKWVLPTGIGAVVALIVVLLIANSGSDETVIPTPSTANTTELDTSERSPSNAPRTDNVVETRSGTSPLPTVREKDFAKVFAAAAEQNKQVSGFNPTAAKNALAPALLSARGCRSGSQPAGTAKLSIQFDNAGQVLSVSVAPPYAGTATAKCIERTIRASRIARLRGSAGRLETSIALD